MNQSNQYLTCKCIYKIIMILNYIIIYINIIIIIFYKERERRRGGRRDFIGDICFGYGEPPLFQQKVKKKKICENHGTKNHGPVCRT